MDASPDTIYPGSVLVVDDNDDILLAAEITLKKHFHQVLVENDPQKIGAHLRQTIFDVVLLDMNFQRGKTSGDEGIKWLNFVQEQAPNTKVILMTAYAGVDLAVRALKGGAADFIIKPWDNAKMLATVVATCRYSKATQEVKQLKDRQALLDQNAGREFQNIIGQSEALNQIMQAVEKVANTDANVLILGENGTGKELIARAIHARSGRREQPMVNIDLGAVSESLFESELFGHKKGAFTDAKEDRSGRFELANGGTLFLDEIGNLSPQSQAKLLGVLETRSVTRVGADRAIKLDVRLICATNLSLGDPNANFSFRQDLLYRINTVELHIPSLRQRRSDIPLLVEYYCRLYAEKYNRPVYELSAQTLEKLQNYDWPGNVRELKHTVERAVIMSEGSTLQPRDFALHKTVDSNNSILNLNELEKDAINRALEKFDGNISRSAEALGLGRATLYRKMSKYGL